MQISRRGLIAGFATFLVAPAIVRASSLMPISVLPPRSMTASEVRMLMQRFFELGNKLIYPPISGVDMEKVWLAEYNAIGAKLDANSRLLHALEDIPILA